MIVLVHGKPRNGKTVFIFLLAFLRACAGQEVISNFRFDHPNAREISPYGLVDLLNGGKVPYKRVLCLQEVYGWFNSYRGMSDISLVDSALMFQSGKLGIDVFCDSQLVGRVDSCIKDMCDARFEAVAVKLCTREKCLGNCPNLGKCHFRYFRLDLAVRDRNVRLPVAPKILPFSVASRFWDKYDTFSVTKPVGWDDLLVKADRLDVRKMRDRVDEQVKLLMAHRELWRKPLKADVAYALMHLEPPQSPAFAGDVAVGLGLMLNR